jgi:hypothetical protein
MPVEIHIDTMIITVPSNEDKKQKAGQAKSQIHQLSKNGQRVLDQMLAGNPQVPGEGVRKGLVQDGEFD